MLRHIITQITRPYNDRIERKNQIKRDSDKAAITELVMEVSREFGYDKESETTEAAIRTFTWPMLCAGTNYVVASEEKVTAFFDPKNETHVHKSLGRPPKVMVQPIQRPDLFAKVVEAAIPRSALDCVTKIRIETYDTTFFDASGTPIVTFYGAGRKMDIGDTFRARNAVQVLQLVDVDSDVNVIALADMRLGAYEELVFEKTDGTWHSYESESESVSG